MANVKIYTTTYCPYCTAAKNLLKQRGVPFEEVVVDRNNDEEWSAMIKRSGMRTVPQIFHGDVLIGGFDDLSALDKRQGLEHLKN